MSISEGPSKVMILLLRRAVCVAYIAYIVYGG